MSETVKRILIVDIDGTILIHDARYEASYFAATGKKPAVRMRVEHPADMALPLFETRELDLSGDQIRKYFDVFDSPEYLHLDEPIPDAKRVLSEQREKGVEIIYLTGRHDEGEKSMRDGTMEWLESHEFPVPDGKGVKLVMKPSKGISRADYKEHVLKNMRRRKANIIAGVGDLLEDALLYARFSIQPIIINTLCQSSKLFPLETMVVSGWDDIEKWLERYHKSSL